MNIKPEDLIITLFNEYKQGGMWCQKSATGVKIYHKPSDIEVAIDWERSQHKNRNICMIILRDLLTEFKEGDIVVSKYGLGQIMTTSAESCTFMLSDDTERLQMFKSVAHTEEGYKYKTKLWVIEKLDALEKEYEDKRKPLVDMLRSLG